MPASVSVRNFLSFLPAAVRPKIVCEFKSTITLKPEHAVVLLVEALSYTSEGRGSIPDGDIEIFH